MRDIIENRMLSIRREPFQKVVTYLQQVEDIDDQNVKNGIMAILKPYYSNTNSLYNYACKYLQTYKANVKWE